MEKVEEKEKCGRCHYWGSDPDNVIVCFNHKSSYHDVSLLEERVEGCSFFKRRVYYKNVIVTGASRGIGKAIAEELASRDYNIALISRNKKEIEGTAGELERKYPGIYLPFICDIRDKDRVKEVFSDVHKELGSIDVLVNNAGFNSRRTIKPIAIRIKLNSLEEDIKGWEEEIGINLTGTYICSYLAADYMSVNKLRNQSIINITSVKGKEPTTSPGYGASKAGIIKLTKDFANVLAPYNIRVNCVAPGFINTGLTSALPAEKKEKYKKMIPMKRFGTVEEVSKVVAFLASNDASYITGATIDVNGGYLMS